MTDYSELQEGLDSDALVPYFEEALAVKAEDEPAVIDVLDNLAELALRQWHTYERAPPAVLKQIVSWLESREPIWASNTEAVESVQAVVLHLGLRVIAERLAWLATESPSLEIRKELASCSMDWTDALLTIEDPWAKLKEQVAAKDNLEDPKIPSQT